MIDSGAGWEKPNMAAYAASKGRLFALAAVLAYDPPAYPSEHRGARWRRHTYGHEPRLRG